jgi:hypothetical protein
MGGGEVGWGDGGWRGIILVWADRWQSIRIRVVASTDVARRARDPLHRRRIIAPPRSG